MVKQNANKKLGGVVVGAEEKFSTCRTYYKLRAEFEKLKAAHVHRAHSRSSCIV